MAKIPLKLARRLVSELKHLETSKIQEAQSTLSTSVFESESIAKSSIQGLQFAVQHVYEDLVNLRYLLRKLVGMANETSGINSLTADLAMLEELAQKPMSQNTFTAKVKTNQVAAGHVFSYNTENVYIMNTQAKSSAMRLKIADLKDKISVLNSTTHITVGDEAYDKITTYLAL